MKFTEHIKRVLVVTAHRTFAKEGIKELANKAEKIADDVGVDCDAGKQIYRSNPAASSLTKYFKRFLYLPYLDSIRASLEQFSKENTPAFSLSALHPFQMRSISLKQFKTNLNSFEEFYNLNGIQSKEEL
ncbi:unnamed protein product [Psylliodes chrysocephalus]|uniref:Uncharacterized protein n=1 Tax=Psylliodes chrysocephalus TaxID=3402493 RepID=A0A9P0GIG7_9CUCU|nr:unnamed protein product [Psylliodes chrysocephala]